MKASLLWEVHRCASRSVACIVVVFVHASSLLAADTLATYQQAYVDQRYGMFVCYNMPTYTGEEWAHAGLSPDVFTPTGPLSAVTDQWAATAKASGMRYGVLTTKHPDGFALWDTTQSSYDIASTSWYSDPGSPNYHFDIVKSYADSFRNQGLGVGLYYSIWDRMNGLGPKFFSDEPTVPQKTSSEATAYVKQELGQLLTAYGPVDVIWTDAWGWLDRYGLGSNGYDYVNYNDVYAYIKQVSPRTLLLENSYEFSLAHTDVVCYEQRPLPVANNTLPSEVCATIRADDKWFYTASGNDALKSVASLGEQIRVVNDRNSSYLLAVTPNKAGLIDASQVQRLAEIKSYLDSPPPLSVAIGKAVTQSSTYFDSASYAAGKGNDVDDVSFTATAKGDFSPWWKVDLGEMTTISEVDLYNRVDWGGRLRDVYVDILGDDGTTVVYTSPLLNPGNVLGGGITNYRLGPNPLTLTLGNAIAGRFVRVRRVPEAGYETDATDHKFVLTLGEVRVFAAVPEPSTCAMALAGLACGGYSLFSRRRDR